MRDAPDAPARPARTPILGRQQGRWWDPEPRKSAPRQNAASKELATALGNRSRDAGRFHVEHHTLHGFDGS